MAIDMVIGPSGVVVDTGSAPLPAAWLVGFLALGASLVVLLLWSRRRLATAAADPRALRGYLTFLRKRDGTPDTRRQTLSRREAFFSRLDSAPVRSRRAIDRAIWYRSVRRHRVDDGLDTQLLWLLATAKANQHERYAVGLSDLLGQTPSVDEDPVRLHLHLQERYHTRILADVAAMFGVDVPVVVPGCLTRLLVGLIVRLPERLALPLAGFSEMTGCTLFRLLRDQGVALCADEPAVAERVGLLYDEILADELSHVAYCATATGPLGRWFMRTAYRWIGPRLVAGLPEIRRLAPPPVLRGLFAAEFVQADRAREFPGRAWVPLAAPPPAVVSVCRVDERASSSPSTRRAAGSPT